MKLTQKLALNNISVYRLFNISLCVCVCVLFFTLFKVYNTFPAPQLSFIIQTLSVFFFTNLLWHIKHPSEGKAPAEECCAVS